jgi:sodium/proline symporter
MGTRDDNKLKLSRRIASIWVVIAMFIAIAIGVIGLSMSKTGIIPNLVGSSESESERLIIEIAFFMSQHGVLLIIVGGLILSGILACTMSTSDSQLLAASSSVSQNILTDWLGIKMSQKASMAIARITVIIIAIIGVILAKNPDSSVFRIVSFSWAGFGASFGPVMIFALFWKRSNRNGALAGMIVGAAMVFIWKFLIAPIGGWLAIYELLPAFLISLAANVIVSNMTAAPSKAITDVFDEVRKK